MQGVIKALNNPWNCSLNFLHKITKLFIKYDLTTIFDLNSDIFESF